MWIICNHFKMMPNNPALRTLTWEQKNWILANIEFDLKQEAAAYSGKKGGTELGLDEDEFKEVSKQMKELAEEQKKRREEGQVNG